MTEEDGLLDEADGRRESVREEAAHRSVSPWALVIGSVIVVSMVAMRSGVGGRSLTSSGGSMVLLSSMLHESHGKHVAHAAALARLHKKTHGSKYQRELASLARKAGPSRKDALAKLV